MYRRIAAAKNDQRKKGRELYVPRLPTASPSAQLCAVAALERWLEALGPDGPVLRTFHLRGQLTSNRLCPGDVGLDPAPGARPKPASTETSLGARRGFVTNAAKKKLPIRRDRRLRVKERPLKNSRHSTQPRTNAIDR